MTQVMKSDEIDRALRRVAHEILERNRGADEILLVGIHTRGVPLAERLSRAIDEYDIHMDPKNREIVANLLISSVKGLDAQYLSITPSQVTFKGKDVHIITVQNVEGTSMIKEIS